MLLHTVLSVICPAVPAQAEREFACPRQTVFPYSRWGLHEPATSVTFQDLFTVLYSLFTLAY